LAGRRAAGASRPAPTDGPSGGRPEPRGPIGAAGIPRLELWSADSDLGVDRARDLRRAPRRALPDWIAQLHSRPREDQAGVGSSETERVGERVLEGPFLRTHD